MTRYKVLWLYDGENEDVAAGAWFPITSCEANSAEAAVRSVAALRGRTAGDGAGTYVAVPERSWQPQEVAVETQTRLKLGPVAEAPAGESEE